MHNDRVAAHLHKACTRQGNNAPAGGMYMIGWELTCRMPEKAMFRSTSGASAARSHQYARDS